MAKFVPGDWPNLKQTWESYGHAIKFEDLDGIKVRSDGCYVVVRWKDDPNSDEVQMADLYRVSRSADWEFQNDGCEPTTEKGWNKLRIPQDCDWFVIPGKGDNDE